MRRPVLLCYGVCAYVAFLVAFGAMIDFVADGGYLVRGIDQPPTAPLPTAIAIDGALILLFGISHSVLARPAVKALVARVLPEPAERSTYTLIASVTLALLVWQWRALPEPVWTIGSPLARGVVWAIQGLGLAIALMSTFLIDHFDLFGLRQTWIAARGQRYRAVPFVERSLYRWVRHPLMVGTLIWFWATPRMSVGHLVFAAAMTAYIVVGVAIEERGLAASLGAPYADYRRRVRAFVPLPKRP